MKKNINIFLDHAPKTELLKKFFINGDTFFETSTIGAMKMSKLKRFLYDAEFLNKQSKMTTQFFKIIRKIGWYSSTAWALIFINLVYNNSQIGWYIENLPINEMLHRKIIEEKLQQSGMSKKSAQSITRTFKRLCETPLGTSLKIGMTQCKGKFLSSLKRTNIKINDGRVFLYALYKFAECSKGRYQFNLSQLMNDSYFEKVSPTKIFTVDEVEMQQICNGLSTKYPLFLNATFTHDLEKISLNSEKTAQDILALF